MQFRSSQIHTNVEIPCSFPYQTISFLRKRYTDRCSALGIQYALLITFIIKTLDRRGTLTELPQLNKGHLKKNPTANIIYNSERLNAVSLDENKDKNVHYFHSYSAFVQARAIKQEKGRKKRYLDQKEKGKARILTTRT